jgi:steroid delta-isomerase-like uncharacterized protein
MTMDHTATQRRLYDRLNARDFDGFAAFLADDFVEHEDLPGGVDPTREGVVNFFRGLTSAFPDLTFTVEDVVDGGGKVVARARFTGTQDGEFAGMPPTGKSVDVQLIDIMRYADDGLVHEHWGVLDAMAMMQQLGAVPS